MQTMHTLTAGFEHVHCVQTKCTLGVFLEVYAKVVCTKSADAHFMHNIYADILQTKQCKLQECA